ncbi:MAG: UV-damage endonuclease [Sarea resinae]|nr:MAG: UV-damage endonuclease [Sarea resinae]
MVKRKRSSAATATTTSRNDLPAIPLQLEIPGLKAKRTIKRAPTRLTTDHNATEPDFDSTLHGQSGALLDPQTLAAAGAIDATTQDNIMPSSDFRMPDLSSDSSLSDLSEIEKENKPLKGKKAAKGKPRASNRSSTSPTKSKSDDIDTEIVDPEAEGLDDVDEEEVREALTRPPPVHSDFLPLPWNGRLGYACLCTYLRYSNPPVFSSRTCRIASILEHRHPLKDPNQPEHAIKNRPDKEQPASISRGQAYVENIGLANARDIIKMLKWNDRYGIKFLRLSSEMFPFASHEEYGYKLEPFAAEVLKETGKVVAELGHRVSTHPGQFTQLGSPRKEVIRNAIRDLEYHAEMLSLLKLPPQQDRDAVMILHMGGVFGDKEATLNRFRENYKGLSQNIKNRLVLENDDVSWSVHDLLPICKELNIPMVLDYHHHNIIFDAEKVREGTMDLIPLYDEISETWTRKRITQKMHYSEPTPSAITGRQRRKHNPRVATLPPCDPTMDLMIEAKDKEQAVFELMRTFRLPGWNSFSDIIPHVRNDDNKPVKVPKKTTPKKRSKKVNAEEVEVEAAEHIEEELAQAGPSVVPEEDVGMGGPEGRVYWPPGMEEWLRPVKRVVKKKTGDDGKETLKTTPVKKRKIAAKSPPGVGQAVKETTPPIKKAKATVKKAARKKRVLKSVPTPSTSDEEDSEAPAPISDVELAVPVSVARGGARKSSRAKKISYAESD